jgi:hypothetical protein
LVDTPHHIGLNLDPSPISHRGLFQTGIKNTATTDSKGFYSFLSLPVGTYDIEVSHGLVTGARDPRIMQAGLQFLLSARSEP